jgi:hypothetical protein
MVDPTQLELEVLNLASPRDAMGVGGSPRWRPRMSSSLIRVPEEPPAGDYAS